MYGRTKLGVDVMTARGDIVTYGGTIKSVSGHGTTMIMVKTVATAVGGTDTFTIDLAKYGCKFVHGVFVWDNTTDGQVLVPANKIMTTSVTAGVLTVTLGTTDADATNTCVKSVLIYAY
jgi:hypothetical protein